MVDTSEKNFEATIVNSLINNGYRQRNSNDYDRSLCLLPQDVFNFKEHRTAIISAAVTGKIDVRTS